MTITPDDLDKRSGDSLKLILLGDASAAAQARRSVRATLLRWQLPSLVDACVLVASELATNAFRHGMPPSGLMLRYLVGDVRMDVFDSDPRLVPTRTGHFVHAYAESGRGLDIVRALADLVGSEYVEGHGKSVYACWHAVR